MGCCNQSTVDTANEDQFQQSDELVSQFKMGLRANMRSSASGASSGKILVKSADAPAKPKNSDSERPGQAIISVFKSETPLECKKRFCLDHREEDEKRTSNEIDPRADIM